MVSLAKLLTIRQGIWKKYKKHRVRKHSVVYCNKRSHNSHNIQSTIAIFIRSQFILNLIFWFERISYTTFITFIYFLSMIKNKSTLIESPSVNV
jgi:hypothetical protein